jgi:hypothetical protein
MASKRHKKGASITSSNANLSNITTRLSSQQRKDENNKKIQKSRTQAIEKSKLRNRPETCLKPKKINNCVICGKIFKGL